MNSKEGRFERIDDGIVLQPGQGYKGMPVLSEQEVVEIKGVKFRVTSMGRNGKLRLKMIPAQF